MPATFREILDSRIVPFFVGKHVHGTSSEFRVHEEAIAQLSQPLRAIVNKDFGNDPEIWPDVSKGTFERLAQFAYTGDYTVPMPVRRREAVDEQEAVNNEPSPDTLNGNHAVEEGDIPPPPPEDIPTEDIPIDDTWGGSWGAPARLSLVALKKKARKERLALMSQAREAELEPEPEPIPPPVDFPSLSFPLLAPRDNHRDGCEPSEKFNPEEDFTTVFLSHAQLWTLADIHSIDSLKALALHKLHKSLCIFEINNKNAEEVLHLVRYAYSDHSGGLVDGGLVGDKLKELVAQYMACNSATLSHAGNFMELLREGGLFVEDFLRLVMQRIQ